MQFSFWEKQYLNDNQSYVIVGSGIVGLSTAIELKIASAQNSVIVIDRFFPPQGASTKNAGFACFGSVTELIDDLSVMSENDVIEIIKMRWQGIKILEERLALKGVQINYNGGKELFDDVLPTNDEITKCNDLMYQATGVEKYFQLAEQSDFSGFNTKCIEMKSEGELNAYEMFNALYQIALELEVKFVYGYNVNHLNFDKKEILLNDSLSLNYHKLIICTNGFTKKLFKDEDIKPARNQVCMTRTLNGLTWKGVYHYDKGYYYFRSYGGRILLGGARNFDPSAEETDEMEFNARIKEQLTTFLYEKLLSEKTENEIIDTWWTGILGMGKSKYPILKKYNEDCIIGVRLGGMGVAIGSYLGKKLAELALNKSHD